VRLVAPRQVQRAPNRPKTDGHDCQWIHRLHSLGLLTAAFRPAEPLRVWRSSQRHRAPLIEDAGRPVQRLEQALEQRNGQLPAVVSAITGMTGMGILRASVRGSEPPAPSVAPGRNCSWEGLRCSEVDSLRAPVSDYRWFLQQNQGARVLPSEL
jgi:hypothetical protein